MDWVDLGLTSLKKEHKFIKPIGVSEQEASFLLFVYLVRKISTTA